MLAIGVVFLAIGFVDQGLTLNFESSFFTMGLIFTLAGAAAKALEKRKSKEE